MNREVLGPRGLEMVVLKDVEVLQMLGLNERLVWERT
jgi:hypothetical protein